MRVLQIGAEWPTEHAGGLNTYFFELIRALTNQGTNVQGLVVGSDQIRSSSFGRVAAFAAPDASLPVRMWKARRAATAILQNQPIDLLAVHFALYAAPIIDHLQKKPTVVHFHGPWAFESGFEGGNSFIARVKSALERGVYSRASRLIVLSQAFKQDLISKYGVHSDRICIIPGGVDVERFNVTLSRAEARDRLGWPNDRPILVSVRRLVRRMGLENLISAAGLISRQHPEFRLYLGGTGPMAEELQTQIEQLELQEQVKLLGRISNRDLPLAYRAADLSVVPSQALEGFGLIAVESLAAGTPVYVSPVGGLPEIVRPFAPECVFNDTTTESIAEVLSSVLTGRVQMPSEQACRDYAVTHFSWKDIASRVLALYNGVGGG